MHYRNRQHRPRAINEPGHAHELTFSSCRKYPFLTERTCPWLAEAIRDACDELQYSRWADVFMPDHVHLVIFPRDPGYDDSDFLKEVKETVSRKAVAFLKERRPNGLRRSVCERGRSSNITSGSRDEATIETSFRRRRCSG